MSPQFSSGDSKARYPLPKAYHVKLAAQGNAVKQQVGVDVRKLNGGKIMTPCNDNYSLTFRRSELAWKLYFPFFPRGHQEINEGSHQMPQISKYTRIYRHPCWLWLVAWSDCFALWELLFPAMYVTFAHTFFLVLYPLWLTDQSFDACWW